MQQTSAPATLPRWLLILIVGIIVGVSMGRAQSMGLYLPQVTKALDIGRELFALSMALAQLRMGIGYGLLPMPQVLPFLPEGRLAAWGGAGGSLVIADVDRRLTFAYVMNKMVPAVVGPIASAPIRTGLEPR